MRKSRVKNSFLTFIICTHVLFLFILLFSPNLSLKKKNKKPLVVKTIALTPKKMVAAAPKAVSPAPQAAKPAPKSAPQKTKIPAPAPQKKAEPAIANKVISKNPVSTPPPTPAPRAKISDSLLKELEASIAKMDEKTVPSKTTIKPQPLHLEIDAQDAAQDTDLLILTLREQLKLPEYGEVTIELTLLKNGKVNKVSVLKTQSEKNKRYLETHLPHISFPPLSENQKTFVFNFCNE